MSLHIYLKSRSLLHKFMVCYKSSLLHCNSPNLYWSFLRGSFIETLSGLARFDLDRYIMKILSRLFEQFSDCFAVATLSVSSRSLLLLHARFRRSCRLLREIGSHMPGGESLQASLRSVASSGVYVSGSLVSLFQYRWSAKFGVESAKASGSYKVRPGRYCRGEESDRSMSRGRRRYGNQFRMFVVQGKSKIEDTTSTSIIRLNPRLFVFQFRKKLTNALWKNSRLRYKSPASSLTSLTTSPCAITDSKNTRCLSNISVGNT